MSRQDGKQAAGLRRPAGAVVAAAVVAAAVILVEACWLVAALPGAALVSDLGGMLVAGWATLACVGVARRHPAPLRRFWTLLAVTMALAAIGRAIWTVQRLVGGDLPHTPVVGVAPGWLG